MAGASQETQLSILFADLCDSTRLYEDLGDKKAREITGICLRRLADVCARHGGTLVKTIGDEILVIFPAADDSAEAACRMHELVTAGLPGIERQVSVRIGFHFGTALLEEDDIFGDAVNLAARITDQAKAGQILTTAGTVSRLSRPWQSITRAVDRTVPRGKKDQVGLFELLWQDEGVTRMGGITEQTADNEPVLHLQWRGKNIEVTAARPLVSMGRAEVNDVVITHELTSRLHARIEYRKKRFILIDLSTNGTYVRSREGQESFIRRDQMALEGEGMICLGRSSAADMGDSIHFRLENPAHVH
jgi:class 3 adenylate cyclase